jgi:hypothetical protein
MYIYTLSLTLELVAFEMSTPRPGRSIPQKESRTPLFKTLGGPKCRSVLDDTLQFTAGTVERIELKMLDISFNLEFSYSELVSICLSVRLSTDLAVFLQVQKFLNKLQLISLSADSVAFTYSVFILPQVSCFDMCKSNLFIGSTARSTCFLISSLSILSTS